jgi:RNA polymerase sigma factor (sigma-70 family)
MGMARPNDGNENSLAERIRNGHEKAFEEFRAVYSAPFYYYFRRRGLSEADAVELAADCVTDIPLKVRDHFNPSHTCFGAWVNLLRKRAATNWWRRTRHFDTVELDPDFPAPDEEEAESEAEALSAVRESLGALEPLDRELLLLRYNGQLRLSFAEIARELSQRNGKEIKVATIRQRHARALSKLEGKLRSDSRLTKVLEKVNA